MGFQFFFQRRLPSKGYLIVPWLQCLFLFWGMVCSLTRITDHRHHWWDVLAGSACGVIVAVFTVGATCKSMFWVILLLDSPKISSEISCRWKCYAIISKIITFERGNLKSQWTAAGTAFGTPLQGVCCRRRPAAALLRTTGSFGRCKLRERQYSSPSREWKDWFIWFTSHKWPQIAFALVIGQYSQKDGRK